MNRKLLIGLLCFAIPVVSVSEGFYIPKSVVRVSAETSKSTRRGNGVVLSERVVATNCHITNLANEITVETFHKGGISAKQAFQNQDYDLCLIRTSSDIGYKNASFISDFDLNTPLHITSWYGIKPAAMVRELYNYPHNRVGPKMIHIEVGCKKGDSGSGVFDDDDRLVGLIVASYDPDGTCLALPAEVVSDSFYRYKNKSVMNYSEKEQLWQW